MNTQELIAIECDFIKKMLIQKNKDYGNSAINPTQIFSSADKSELINIRIDDKLSRIKNKTNKKTFDEDTVLDLIGYLILKRVAEKHVCGGNTNAEQNNI